MLEIYLLRHGQTYHNLDKVLAGQSNGELTKTGIEQSILAGKFLKDIEFDYVYMSELKRVVDTFEEVRKIIPQTYLLIKEPLIKEINGGNFEGRNISEMVKFSKERKIDIRHVKDGGESFNDVYERAKLFLLKIQKAHLQNQNSNPKKILIVSHGGFFMEFFNALANIAFGTEPVFHLRGGNCAVSKIYLSCKNTYKLCSKDCKDSKCLSYIVSYKNNNEFIIKEGKESIKSLI